MVAPGGRIVLPSVLGLPVVRVVPVVTEDAE